MKPYKIRVEVTTAYSVEAHAELQEEAEVQVGVMNLDQIENAGEFEELVKVEVTDSEVLYPEDEDEESFSDSDIDPPEDVSTEPIEDAVIMPEDENDHSDQS